MLNLSVKFRIFLVSRKTKACVGKESQQVAIGANAEEFVVLLIQLGNNNSVVQREKVLNLLPRYKVVFAQVILPGALFQSNLFVHTIDTGAYRPTSFFCFSCRTAPAKQLPIQKVEKR